MNTNFKTLSEETILSQYSDSPHIKGIIDIFQQHLATDKDFQLFYDKIMNLETAEGVGLDIWGAIVGVDRTQYFVNNELFGFENSLLHPFNNRPFWDHSQSRIITPLDDTSYRDLIIYKALANISDGSLKSTDTLIRLLLKQEHVYVHEVAPMAIRIAVGAIPSDRDIVLLRHYLRLSMNAGVDWLGIIVDLKDTFGFAGSNLMPFDQGIFVYQVVTEED